MHILPINFVVLKKFSLIELGFDLMVFLSPPDPNSVSFVSSLPTIFNFQPNTNRILVYDSDILDRETQDTYTFTINATDSEGLSSSANVTVTLTDVNDQIPIINNTE